MHTNSATAARLCVSLSLFRSLRHRPKVRSARVCVAFVAIGGQIIAAHSVELNINWNRTRTRAQTSARTHTSPDTLTAAPLLRRNNATHDERRPTQLRHNNAAEFCALVVVCFARRKCEQANRSAATQFGRSLAAATAKQTALSAAFTFAFAPDTTEAARLAARSSAALSIWRRTRTDTKVYVAYRSCGSADRSAARSDTSVGGGAQSRANQRPAE